MSIPGADPRTSEAVLAYTDDVNRFGNYKQYCSYFGLTPRLDESGSCRRLGHISKRGPSVVRWVICESSWRSVLKSPAKLKRRTNESHESYGLRVACYDAYGSA